VHAAQAPVSSWHWKPAVVSGEVKAKLALVSGVVAAGPDVIVVSGATVSIVHVTLAGVASTLPDESVARTRKVCEPSARPV
jgi:hypothetical protein